MKLNNSKKILNRILKTAQIGQHEIYNMANYAVSPNLRSALKKQLIEYGQIEFDAGMLACQRGWDLQETDPVMRYFCGLYSRIGLRHKQSDPRIVVRMIHRNNRDMAIENHSINQLPVDDEQIYILSQRLLDCLTENNRKMKHLLYPSVPNHHWHHQIP